LHTGKTLSGLALCLDSFGKQHTGKPLSCTLYGRCSSAGVVAFLPNFFRSLQGHIDMVTEKNSDVIHDFFKDPIRLRLEGGWIKAEGTTLGAGAVYPPLNSLHYPLSHN